jgi:hypothetical protein
MRIKYLSGNVLAFLLLSTTAVYAGSSVRRAPKLVEQAYHDATDVLKRSGACARFYGDRDVAMKVLGMLVGQMHSERMPEIGTGLRMAGDFTIRADTPDGPRYRLFRNVNINSIGPFFRRISFLENRPLPHVGSFAPNTREARMLMLLHELAHLIDRDGQWLIPDDGYNPELSATNTSVVEKMCKEDILSVTATIAR